MSDEKLQKSMRLFRYVSGISGYIAFLHQSETIVFSNKEMQFNDNMTSTTEMTQKMYGSMIGKPPYW